VNVCSQKGESLPAENAIRKGGKDRDLTVELRRTGITWPSRGAA